MASLSEIQSTLPLSCKIIAVSKLQPVEKMRALYAQGQRDFAENYVQEALPKMAELSTLDLQWHFIGRLQRNKAKFVVGHFHLIHSVDSLQLAQEIHKHASEKGLRQRVLLQVNLAKEETKGGFDREQLHKDLPALRALSGLEIAGLMTMPPLFDNAEQTRPYFHELKNLRDELQKNLSCCQELSMGTSADYQVAASEGATLVRLGTILFGERPLPIHNKN